MLNAYTLGLALALAAQLGNGRYPITPPADADAAADAGADAAPGADTGSQIVIPVDTPQPTLVDDPAAAPAGCGGARSRVAACRGRPARFGRAAGRRRRGGTRRPHRRESSVLAGGPKPADVMRDMLEPPSNGQLPGNAVTLGSAVGSSATRQAQTERIQAYWDLSAAVAQYYLALQESVELAALQQGVSAPSPAWATAREQFDARVETTREDAVAAQWRLHRLMGGAPGGVAPAAGRLCRIAAGTTRGTTKSSPCGPTPAAEQLNELLPLLHGELTTEARRVADAGEWLSFVSEHRDPATDGTGLLRAYELMSAASPGVHRRGAAVQ